MSERTRLLLVFGGRSSEHEVSLRSATEIRAAIDRQRFDLILLGIRRDGTWCTGPAEMPLAEVIERGEPVRDLLALGPDLVFPALHGPYGEDGTFQGLLEVLGLPYVGSGVLASALCMDKAVVKRFLAAQEPPIPVVPWVEVDGDELADPERARAIAGSVSERLGYPCFVKPANQGSSVGVSRATSADELATALELAARYDPKIIVEKGLRCREIEVAVLGDGGPSTMVSDPGEIRLPPGLWYDYDNKYIHDVATLHIPADLPASLRERLRVLALRAFRATGCQGLARVDFFVDEQSGEPYLNEVNTMPGFTTISMYPKMMGAAGVPYGELITRLCDLALLHHKARQGLRITR
ncbi:MAG: D-alanine--D-alanine ligase [Myxococcales bacterium]|nr:D-alanine--D-alanine ligase [Myxococcales bacterium]